jgi:hypothetical protein
MAMDRVFQELCERLQTLGTSLDEMGDAALHSRPAESRLKVSPSKDHYLAGLLWEKVVEMQGRQKEAYEAAAEARRAVTPPVNLDGAWRMLKTSQEAVNLIVRESLPDMTSYEMQNDLRTLRAEHPDWAGWVDIQLSHLDQLHALLNNVSDGFLACWQEIAERVGMRNISVHTNSVGQQISAPELTEKS